MSDEEDVDLNAEEEKDETAEGEQTAEGEEEQNQNTEEEEGKGEEEEEVYTKFSVYFKYFYNIRLDTIFRKHFSSRILK